MWTAVHLSVQITLDLARWHVSALWRDDAALDPVMLVKSGDVRITPYDSPDRLLETVMREMARRSAEEDWRLT